MHGKTVWYGHPTLSRPLTIMGVERRWFILTATFPFAMWNILESFLVAGLMFGSLYAAGLIAWRRDPAMLQIITAGQTSPARYDPGKPADSSVELV